jgi:hypothetical protein
MTLTKRQLAQLQKAITIVQDILAQSEASSRQRPAGRTARGMPAGRKSRRIRRNNADVKKLRADVIAARKKGVPVTKLAQKYGVSTAYIYMIK